MSLEELIVGEDLTYQKYPVKILDTSERVQILKVLESLVFELKSLK
jgi:hypothetical protein